MPNLRKKPYKIRKITYSQRPQEEETMPRVRNMLNHHEPLLVAVDYVVDGPRTAAAVAAGRSRPLEWIPNGGRVPQMLSANKSPVPCSFRQPPALV